MGGHLATITSQEENDWIRNNLTSKLKGTEADRFGDRCFIGALRRDATASWEWITGEPMTIEPWMGDSFPDDTTGGRKIATWQRNTWDDVNPDMPPLAFLVEWDDGRPAK